MNQLSCGALTLEFTGQGALPDRILITDAHNGEIESVLNCHGKSQLELELNDGTCAVPVKLADDPILQYERNGAAYLEFPKLGWCDRQGKMLEHFYLSLCYELNPDGCCFVTAFFLTESNTPPPIKRFELTMPLEFSGYDHLRWSLFYRPQVADGTLIQSAAPERFLPPGQDRVLEQGLLPMAGFNATREFGPSLYAELFLEGGNTLSGNTEDNSSKVVWHEGNPVISWNFQNKEVTTRRPWQWRNQWGFLIRKAPTQRHLPPMTMYHFFDNFHRYPGEAVLEAMADSGCEVLAMHENWRLDAQNGGMPYDEKRFRKLLDSAHKHGIRVMSYIRGDENSVVEGHAEWFNTYLQRNYDGLYMDYGGPYHHITPPNESYQNGRIHFKMHYHKLKKLREMIGPDGIFYSHTGPLFSGIGMSFTDGYVSGEGERGVLVRSREEHEYFSMAPVGCGTMWTAAFPEYSSSRMVPFLAATGQYPHNPVGRQMKSSSLAHPPEPGINDRAFLGLWKLWSVFHDERDMTIYCDYNSRNVFAADRETGHYLMGSSDGRKALLIISNFSDAPRQVDPVIDWARTSFGARPSVCTLLDVAGAVPAARTLSAVPETISLVGHGVAALLFTAPGVEVEALLRRFHRPYHKIGATGQAWFEAVEQQRKLRYESPAWERVFLTVAVPFGAPASYEDSLIYDLFDNQLEFGRIATDGSFKRIAYLDKNGLSEAPCRATELFAGEAAATIEITEHLQAGENRMALRSLHGGEVFYSFVKAILSPTPDTYAPEAYTIEFYNDLEADRALLTWVSRRK